MTVIQSLAKELLAARVGEARLGASMAGFTHWRMGVPADLLVLPANEAGLVTTI